MAHDLLNLPHLRVNAVADNGDHYVIEAIGGVEPTACPKCGKGLYRHGTQRQTYMDVPIHGKRNKIEIDRKRYRCKECGKTLFEPLPHMDAKRLSTERLVRYVEQRCLKETFSALSREVGIDDKTIRHIFDDYVLRLEAGAKFQTPEILGIDEVMVIGQHRCTITNIGKLSLYDLLPTRKKADLLPYFRQLPDKHKVKVVVMDMWSVYRQVAQAELPGRPIVADRFHVVRTAQYGMDRVRLAIRKGLDTRTRLQLKDDRSVLAKRAQRLTAGEQATLERWAAQFPELGIAYHLKEEFATLYEHPSRAAAEAAGRAWEARAVSANLPAFRETIRVLRSWREEIFNWYDHRITNAYTKSVNNLVNAANRMGRGYSFEVIRARLLFEKQARDVTAKNVRKHVKEALPPVEELAAGGKPSRLTKQRYRTIIVDEKIEYGPHIPTLVKLLEDGYFD